jgi:hypothetical protein
MRFDGVFSAKTRLRSVHLPRYKGNALNDFCGNRCGKTGSANPRTSYESHAQPGTAAIFRSDNYLYLLAVRDHVSIRQLLVFRASGLPGHQTNLHRFGAFCSLKVTGKGICLSDNGRLSAGDFHATRIATPSVDSLRPQGYSDFDQRHWRQAEVLR